jgi:hypothetical protein
MGVDPLGGCHAVNKHDDQGLVQHLRVLYYFLIQANIQLYSTKKSIQKTTHMTPFLNKKTEIIGILNIPAIMLVAMCQYSRREA